MLRPILDSAIVPGFPGARSGFASQKKNEGKPVRNGEKEATFSPFLTVPHRLKMAFPRSQQVLGIGQAQPLNRPGSSTPVSALRW